MMCVQYAANILEILVQDSANILEILDQYAASILEILIKNSVSILKILIKDGDKILVQDTDDILENLSLEHFFGESLIVISNVGTIKC